jgi:hypothetical protein
MSEATDCCGTTCDKAKLNADQARVVAAFDQLDDWQAVCEGHRLYEGLAELREAMEALR